jgi:hypothetical protein
VRAERGIDPGGGEHGREPCSLLRHEVVDASEQFPPSGVGQLAHRLIPEDRLQNLLCRERRPGAHCDLGARRDERGRREHRDHHGQAERVDGVRPGLGDIQPVGRFGADEFQNRALPIAYQSIQASVHIGTGTGGYVERGSGGMRAPGGAGLLGGVGGSAVNECNEV